MLGKTSQKPSFSPECTMASLFILLFYISFIESFRLLAITGVLVVLYGIWGSRDGFFLRLTKPVLPFVALMLLPLIIRYLFTGDLVDLDFTLMIVGKLLLSSILLGTVVSRYSILYLLEGVLGLGLPAVFNRILALTFRYFHMIYEDIEKGRKALVSRGINERRGLASLSIFGQWIGGFFLKSHSHGERVFNAMKLRGFQGETGSRGLKNKRLVIRSSALIVILVLVLIIDGKV